MSSTLNNPDSTCVINTTYQQMKTNINIRRINSNVVKKEAELIWNVITQGPISKLLDKNAESITCISNLLAVIFIIWCTLPNSLIACIIGWNIWTDIWDDKPYFRNLTSKTKYIISICILINIFIFIPFYYFTYLQHLSIIIKICLVIVFPPLSCIFFDIYLYICIISFFIVLLTLIFLDGLFGDKANMVQEEIKNVWHKYCRQNTSKYPDILSMIYDIKQCVSIDGKQKLREICGVYNMDDIDGKHWEHVYDGYIWTCFNINTCDEWEHKLKHFTTNFFVIHFILLAVVVALLCGYILMGIFQIINGETIIKSYTDFYQISAVLLANIMGGYQVVDKISVWFFDNFPLTKQDDNSELNDDVLIEDNKEDNG
eukprot:877540_1